MNSETTTTTAEPTTATPEPRAANGRFAKGNRGGPGNPFARQTAQSAAGHAQCRFAG